MLVLVHVRYNELAQPIAATCAKVQGCIGGESTATCDNLTNLEFEPSLPRQKARTYTTGTRNRNKTKRYAA